MSTQPTTETHVFNPISRSWVKRGSQVHTRLIAAGLLPEPTEPLVPPATTRGNHMRSATVLKRRIDAAVAAEDDPKTKVVLGKLLQEYEAEMKQPRVVGGPKLSEREGPARTVKAPKGVAAAATTVKAPRRRRQVEEASDASDAGESPAPRRPPPSAAAVRAHARKLLSARIEQIMNENQTEFSSLSEGEVEDRISRILQSANPSAAQQVSE